MINKPLTRIVLLCLALFLAGLAIVHAQEPYEQESITVDPAGRLDLTFEQLGYAVEQLSRERSDRSYIMDLPGNFQISPTGNYFDLVTNHFPEIPDKPAVLRVEMNGSLLTAFPLTKSNAISNTVHIALPEGLIQAGSNRISIGLDTSATCEDPGAIVSVVIDNGSALSFGYEQNPYPLDLSLYPFPFVEDSLLNVPTALVLPDEPTESDLSTAATIAAGLGQMSGGVVELKSVLVSELSPDIQNSHHLIVIGKPGEIALLDDLELPLPIDATTLDPGQGVLEEIVSPWSAYRLILVVSGLDDAGMSNAGYALNRQAHFLSMRGAVAIVTHLRPLSTSVVPRTSSMTLASLGYTDETIYGAQPQDNTIYFALPLGWQLEELPFFVLKFAHAQILDPNGSAIDVSLNGIPIGSTLLDSSNASAGELTLSLPKHALRTGRNRLKVEVEMNFLPEARDKCSDLGDERAWTVISSESEIFLPYSAIALPPDLALIPYPFVRNAELNQTLFVVPDQPSSQILNSMIRLSVLLGSPSQAEYAAVYVTFASNIDQDMQENNHLILLGRPTENALLRTINAYLPHPFAPNSDILEPLAIDSVAFLPNPDRDAGLLEIITSPWSEDHSLLVVTGTSAKGTQMATQALLEQYDALAGNLAVVEPVIAALSPEPNSISVYTIDTRSPSAINEGMSTSDADVEDDLAILARRWWR